MVGIIGIAGAAGAITLRSGGATSTTQTSTGNVSLRQEAQSGRASAARAPRPLMPTPAKSVPAPTEEITATPAAPTPVPVVVPPTGGSMLSQGRTTLSDSIYAVRSGDSVTVNFDTQGYRTRRADKFEQMVRTTLPLVYGRRITASLDSVPAGSLLPSRDVMGVLMSEGVHLTLDNGLRISLWPQSRPFNDGPLVVAYRVVVER